MKIRTPFLHVTAIGVASLLLGCAALAPLYHWKSYPDQVYSYLKNDGTSAEQQIQALEEGLAQMQTSAALPPGYHAHLGLLYLKVGRTNDALLAWEREKTLFPESTRFIDHLIGNLKKNEN